VPSGGLQRVDGKYSHSGPHRVEHGRVGIVGETLPNECTREKPTRPDLEVDLLATCRNGCASRILAAHGRSRSACKRSVGGGRSGALRGT